MVLVWFVLFTGGIIFAAFTGNMAQVNGEILKQAASAGSFALGLIGIMALWLGLMKIAEKSGLADLLAKAIWPITRRLFPDIPKDSPAQSSIALSLAAVMLGLLDASTPMCIKALKDMQEYNPHPDTVSDSQAVYTAILTSNIALVVPTVLAARVAAKSANPSEIIGPTIIVTTISTILNVALVKWMQNWKAYKIGQ
ncbi:MAG TPA: nucleoside recognition protein [Firmicutes bacterium]|nr:nucleoside recognition protein [Bacillota bacterium]